MPLASFWYHTVCTVVSSAARAPLGDANVHWHISSPDPILFLSPHPITIRQHSTDHPDPANTYDVTQEKPKLSCISDPDLPSPISGFNSFLTFIALYKLYSFIQVYTLFVYKLQISSNQLLPPYSGNYFYVICLRKSPYLISPSSNDFLNLFTLSLLGSSFPPGWSFAIWPELWQVRRCRGWRRDMLWYSSAVTEHVSKGKIKWDVWTNGQVLTP